ncbi:MAG: serine/threonine-protein kinase, partial [Acidobacteriota bacterium]
MTPERWRRIKDLFTEALDLDVDDRSELYARLRGDDPELADEVASLVASHETPTTLGGLVPPASGEDPMAETRWQGRQLGHYRLIRRLGRGGMGAVFLAERTDDISAQVAIKLVQPAGAGARASAIAQRFLDERQIAAQLVHPNIARMLDGGTTEDDVPYLVLEYVDGVPLDVFCNQHRLGVDERLELLATVCEAVHYAHQNLVVHRDLKPSNIVVTADGVPKLLDFGVAKMLNPDLTPAKGRTRSLAQAPMTPDYASPEQFLGEPVSTASDVYALGVIAHHLLTGCSPYGAGPMGLAEVARRVCAEQATLPSETVRTQAEAEVEGWFLPESPRKVARRLTGDLDAIITRALVKEPAERYPSADELAREIRRHLEGLPVRVRGDRMSYVFLRWLVRRRGWWLAAAMLALSVVVGLAATVRQERIAERERARAEQRVADVRELLDGVLLLLEGGGRASASDAENRRRVGALAARHLDVLAAGSGGDPEHALAFVRAFRRLGVARAQIEPLDAAAVETTYRRALGVLDDQ